MRTFKKKWIVFALVETKPSKAKVCSLKSLRKNSNQTRKRNQFKGKEITPLVRNGTEIKVIMIRKRRKKLQRRLMRKIWRRERRRARETTRRNL